MASGRRVDALVLVLPKDYETKLLSQDEAATWWGVQTMLMNTRLTFPVMFARECDEINAMVGSILIV
jgi:hypothetical protein